MWKYRCKSHLIALVVAFLVGLCLSAVVFASGIDMSSDMLSSSLSSVPGVDTESLKQVLTYLQNNMWILCLIDFRNHQYHLYWTICNITIQHQPMDRYVFDFLFT